MTFWYLATPYTKFPQGLSAAYRMAAENAAIILAAGVPVYSPIVHGHVLAMVGKIDPVDPALWVAVDKPMVDAAGGLIVLRGEGWDSSFGVTHEREAFEAAGKPTVFMDLGEMPSLPPLAPVETLPAWVADVRATNAALAAARAELIRADDKVGECIRIRDQARARQSRWIDEVVLTGDELHEKYGDPTPLPFAVPAAAVGEPLEVRWQGVPQPLTCEREEAALPPFVIAGEWVDPHPPFPIHGRRPRQHPYDPLAAYRLVEGDRILIFPTQADAATYLHGKSV